MIKHRAAAVWAGFFVTLASACVGGTGDPTSIPDDLRPPAKFKEADLWGTWEAEYGLVEVDTITLNSDGTYQQVFTGLDNYSYSSPSNRWWVEYRSSGCVYVHLEGMRYYASSRSIGEKGGRAPSGDPLNFFDLCEYQQIQMVDKVILRVNTNPNVSHSIELAQMKTHLEGGNSFFFLISSLESP